MSEITRIRDLEGIITRSERRIIKVKIAVLLRLSEAEAAREVDRNPTVEKPLYSEVHNRTQRDY
jgi:hypothetical protein